jgi:DnaJ-class molecular chaperone
MDNREGQFVPVSEENAKEMDRLRENIENLMGQLPEEEIKNLKGKLPSVFSVGEELEIKGSKFQVTHVDNDGKGGGRLNLKLLPRQNGYSTQLSAGRSPNQEPNTQICPECGGTGQDNPPPGKYHGICKKCNGTGKLRPA